MTTFFAAMAAAALLALALCAVSALDIERPLTQAQIAKQSAYCRSYGLMPVYYTNGQDTRIRSVQCERP